MLALIGVRRDDGPDDADWLAARLVHLRMFQNERGRFDASLLEVLGEALVVSQFTLYGDTRKGRRPSFADAADPDVAEALYGRVADAMESYGVSVGRGRFGADMQVSLVNDGPVTLMVDSGMSRSGRAKAVES